MPERRKRNGRVREQQLSRRTRTMSCRLTTIASSSRHGSTRRPRPSPTSLVESCYSTLICPLPSCWSPTPPSSPTTARPSATTRPQRTNLGTSGRSSPHLKASSSSNRSTREETRSVRQSSSSRQRRDGQVLMPSALLACLAQPLALPTFGHLSTSSHHLATLDSHPQDRKSREGWMDDLLAGQGRRRLLCTSHRTVLAEGLNVRITSES